jgi:hypothetical protein
MLSALGALQAHQEPHPGAPIVGDQIDALELEGVEQREHILGESLLGVGACGRVAPTEPAQVRADQPAFAGQQRDHLAPAEPVLRPAVQQQHGLSAAGFGDVEANARYLHVAVGHAVELRHRRLGR